LWEATTKQASATQREVERRAELLARLEQWTEKPLTALALLLIPLLLAPLLFDISGDAETVLLGADYVIWGLFVADLVAKVIIAPDRLAYVRRNWLDVVLVAVPILRPLRAARAVRLVWVVGAAGRVFAGSGRFLARRGTGWLLLSGMLVMVVAAALVVVVERDDPHASITTFGDGLWWAIATVTTVGYGDTYPLTPLGRGIAVALMVLGIAAFGLVTANHAALFVEQQDDEMQRELRVIKEQLVRIEATLERLSDDAASRQ
jgi:voltage-gated potassium channel